ncbi:WD40 repeat domain-containing protein, partial [Frankia sp. CcWB3]
MRADSFAGQVLAVLSRRTPAFTLPEDEPQTFPDRARALLLRTTTKVPTGHAATVEPTRGSPAPPNPETINLSDSVRPAASPARRPVSDHRRQVHRTAAAVLAVLAVLVAAGVGSLAVREGDPQPITPGGTAHLLGAPLTGRTGAVTSVAFSPGRGTLAAAGVDGTVQLWDVTNPATPRQLDPLLTGRTGAVTSVAFSPNGGTLATAGDDGTLRLWNVTDPTSSYQLHPLLPGYPGAVASVAFSPDGRTLATGGAASDGIRLWDVTDLTSPHQLGTPFGISLDGSAPKLPPAVLSVVFSPDGRTLAIDVPGAWVQLWDV